MSSQVAAIRLKKNEERRLRAGHLWVFSNEIDNALTPLAGFEPGQLVEVLSHRGKPAGFGYVNPNSLIAVRLLAARPQPVETLLRERLGAALALRRQLFERPFYRLVNGEGDLLPGLVVDRFDDVAVMQLNTYGMERLRDALLNELRALLPLSAIVLRNDSSARALEGLTRDAGQVFGEAREHLLVEEGECRFQAPFTAGQKTGWYYDQRETRERMLPYVAGKRVLDAYCYLGAWAVRSARAGARHVSAIDTSHEALTLAGENARRNECAERVQFIQDDVPRQLAALHAAGESFDVVVLDPPPLIKRRKDLRPGQAHYARINRLAARLLSGGGLLVSCSCSHHMSSEMLRRAAYQGLRDSGRSAQLVASGGQGADHPRHPAMPETDYLTAVFFRALP